MAHVQPLRFERTDDPEADRRGRRRPERELQVQGERVAAPDAERAQDGAEERREMGARLARARGRGESSDVLSVEDLGAGGDEGAALGPARAIRDVTRQKGVDPFAQRPHRLGAVVAGTMLIAVGLKVLTSSTARRLRWAGALLALAVLVQITIGVSMVHFGIPLALATLHNAGAALLVIVNVLLLRALRPAASTGAGSSKTDPVPGMVPLQRVDPAR